MSCLRHRVIFRNTTFVLVICPTQHSFTTSIGGKLDTSTIYALAGTVIPNSLLYDHKKLNSDNLFRCRVDKLKEKLIGRGARGH